jgi:recombination protein U
MTINYPIKKQASIQVQSANRGMNLEADLNTTNEYYLATKRAVIHKKPTPVKVVHVSYPSRQAAEITKAYFTTPSTTDYNGIYQGRYIDFEAKETSNTTSFPLQNIHPHQIDHLLSIHAQGGIGFVILSFTKRQELYLLMIEDLAVFVERERAGGRKSIALAELKTVAHPLHYGLAPRLDYLSIIDRVLQSQAAGNASATPK